MRLKESFVKCCLEQKQRYGDTGNYETILCYYNICQYYILSTLILLSRTNSRSLNLPLKATNTTFIKNKLPTAIITNKHFINNNNPSIYFVNLILVTLNHILFTPSMNRQNHYISKLNQLN